MDELPRRGGHKPREKKPLPDIRKFFGQRLKGGKVYPSRVKPSLPRQVSEITISAPGKRDRALAPPVLLRLKCEYGLVLDVCFMVDGVELQIVGQHKLCRSQPGPRMIKLLNFVNWAKPMGKTEPRGWRKGCRNPGHQGRTVVKMDVKSIRRRFLYANRLARLNTLQGAEDQCPTTLPAEDQTTMPSSAATPAK